MTGQTNTGGGSIGAQRKGTIVVAYSSGAACTVTGNGQTYTALDTSGAAAFVVDAGTYTVKAVQGSNSNSKNVSVTAGGWVKVDLKFFDGLLYNNGIDYVGLSFANIENSLFTKTDGASEIKLSKSNTNAKSSCFLYKAVDVTNYSTLSVVYRPANIATHPYSLAIHSNASPTYDGGVVASANLNMASNSASILTTSLDISSFSGVYYVGIFGKAWNNLEITTYVKKIQMT